MMSHIHDEPESVSNLSSADNPWTVPVLDVRPVTRHLISTSGDPACADNAMALQSCDGVWFAGATPESERTVPCELEYPVEGFLGDGVLFAPHEMEQKWALFLHGGVVAVVRSWLLEVRMTATLEIRNDRAVITSIRGHVLDDDESPEFTVQTFDFLMHTHALGVERPAPYPREYADDPEMAARWCFGIHGMMASFASLETPARFGPLDPLRTTSLLHIAAVRGDVATIERLLAEGWPVDLLERRGQTPLDWAILGEETEAAALLVRYGAEQHNTPDISTRD